MSQKRKPKLATVKELAKSNPNVDPATVEKSLELVRSVRNLGFSRRGYDIIETSESRLKVKPPALSKF